MSNRKRTLIWIGIGIVPGALVGSFALFGVPGTTLPGYFNPPLPQPEGFGVDMVFHNIGITFTGLLAVALALVGAVVGARIGKSRRDPLKCVGCGYSLVELTGDKCPECGRTVNSTAPS